MSRREDKIIHAVDCPRCNAPVGQACIVRTQAEGAMARGRLFVHGSRRRAWQAWRKRTPVDIWALPANHGVYLTPESESARIAILSLVEDAEEEPDGRIYSANARRAIDILVADHWRVE